MSTSAMGTWVGHWATTRPEAEALVFLEHRFTWAQLGARVEARAAALCELGVEPGDRVACLMFNRPEAIELLWACQRIGAIYVPINHRLTAPELRDVLEDADPRVLWVEPELAELAAAGAPAGLSVVDVGSLDAVGAVLPRPAVVPPVVALALDDTAIILYTSGTTGRSKGAMISHGNVLASTRLWMAEFGLTAAERPLIGMPLCFTGGLLAASMPSIAAGAAIVLMRSFNAEEALRLIEAERTTWMTAVPTMLERMVADVTWASRDLSSLRGMQAGGAAVPIPLIQAFHHRGIGLQSAYGLTEASAGANLYVPASEALRKRGAIGRPTVDHEARVRRSDGCDAEVGEVGELLLRGPLVFAGYWRNPEATSETIVDGWLRTGDLVTIDEDGYYFVAGRAKDMVISGGLNVYPVEVERVLDQFPGVAESSVIGLADERWGETVVACLRLEPGADGLDEAALLEHCKASLGDYKVPRRFVVVEDFPRTMSGKVRKQELRESIEAGAAT
ncbi:MAG TPA: AMP-binding protein [Baekduia sp.]|jgi:fatty-acyl-CoA synthase